MVARVEFPSWLKVLQEESFPKHRYSICSINGGYYLYEKHSSDGRSHVYLGSLKEDGLHPAKDSAKQSLVSLNQPLPVPTYTCSEMVSEYGFSKAMLDLCPADWKERWGNDAMSILFQFVLSCSPFSYLRRQSFVQPRHYAGAAIRLLNESLPVSASVILEQLGTIWMIEKDGIAHLSSISTEQIDFCQKYSIHLLKEA